MWSLDEEMLSFVPQPVKAVLLLFPARGQLQQVRIKDDAEEGNRFKGDVWYIKQQVSPHTSLPPSCSAAPRRSS